MKNIELLYAIDGIDDKYIRIAAPVVKNNSNHFSLRWLAAAACICLVLLGVGMWYSGIFDTGLPPVVDLPEYNATGGDGIFEYERAYVPKLYQLDSALMDYIVESGGADLYEWLEQGSKELMKSKYNISDPEYIPILLQTIKRYNISKEVFETINNNSIAGYEKNGDYNLIEQVCYTQEEVDALYSNDTAKITEVFATKYAIIVNDKAFAPGFYLNASEKELKKYGISALAVKEKVELLLIDDVITESNE